MLRSEGSVYEIESCKFSLNSCLNSDYCIHATFILNLGKFLHRLPFLVIRQKSDMGVQIYTLYFGCTNLYLYTQSTMHLKVFTLCLIMPEFLEVLKHKKADIFAPT